MADKGEDGAAEGEEKPKGLIGKLLGNKLILIGAGAVLLLLVGGGAYFFLFAGGEKTAEEAALEHPAAPPEPSAYYMDLPVMIVNLSSVDSTAAYVKLAVTLEVSNQEMLKVIEPNMPRVMDAFQTYLRELRTSDLQGSAGLYRLKEELQRRINVAVYPARVDDVLFKNVIVQ
jgi:flagellar FliL protein